MFFGVGPHIEGTMSDRLVKVTRWVVNYTLRPLQGEVDYGLGHPFRYILLAMCDFESQPYRFSFVAIRMPLFAFTGIHKKWENAPISRFQDR